MRSALLLLTIAPLAGGCGSWSGPRAAVEDRPVASVERSRAAAAKPKAAPRRTASRKPTETPRREDRQAAREAQKDAASPGAHAADAVSGDLVLEMKPEKYSSQSR